ncbi:uncharacterized protein LOC123975469 isoform X1 [Micropterus dolomieu]|uniref:uncharacterized protein LOC123975469 isoform X1 n=1 Tax=Micropterus dolomieu TaxID=147949 RepID=UPI001E8D2927|nr:uncharacterized protein LOC123975469 isoform X1 [Micropterus dolomieu]
MIFRMNIQHVLFICFTSGALCNRNTNNPTEIYSGDVPLYTGTKGKSITFEFPFSLAKGRKGYLCKDECNKKDILVRFTFQHAPTQHGRYSIRYHEGVLQLTIAELKTSDSGLYRCGFGRPSLSDLYELGELTVTEALTTFPTTTKQSKQQSTKGTTAQLNTKVSDQCSMKETVDFQLVVAICVTVVIGVLLAVFLLLLYKYKRTTDGLDKRRNSHSTNMEFVTYENCHPVSTSDSTYQRLDPASRDQDRTYFTLHRMSSS